MAIQIPEQMKVISTDSPGGSEQLRLSTREVPKPGSEDVLIALHYAGVNRPDILQRAGSYPPPPGSTDLLGLEGAGEIVAVGEAVTQWSVGDRVCALLPGGGYAEFATTKAAHCLPIPEGYDFEKASGLPEVVLTVWANLMDGAGLKPGETVLVHGGSSGIGTMAIQIGKQFGGRVFVTAGTDEKCRVCEELGAERAINYRTEDFVEVVQSLLGKAAVNIVIDMVGGGYIERNLRLLAVEGRHVSIAFLQGKKVTLDLARVMMRRQILTGSTLRGRPDAEKARLVAAVREKVWPFIEAGKIGAIINRVFPLDECRLAHDLMESGNNSGKILLKIR